MKKIVFLNLIVFLIIYLIAEIGFYYEYRHISGIKIPFIQTSITDIMHYYPPLNFVPFEGTNADKSKKPILLIGCSYTFGQGLNEEETLGGKITELTGRHTYNWGSPGDGIIAMYALYKAEHQKPLISVEPEYVIYTYMFHHIERWGYINYFNFLRKENLISNQHFNIFNNSYIYQHFKYIELVNLYVRETNLKYDLFFDIMKRMKEENTKLFPNSKFVVLLYDDTKFDICEQINAIGDENVNKLFDFLYSQELRKKLEDMGYIVISTEELINRKMDRVSDRIPNDPNRPHPSSTAWEEIVPKLVERLNL